MWMLRGLLVVEYRCRADELSVVSVAARAGGPVVLYCACVVTCM